ncbi:extracellular solute-binding protein [Streptomyces pristinaespiralis]|uniref:ABC transporter solute-binding protein n=3 Tax=Streptomyces pristinaespiralis TaxID=38300 RepID=B5HFY3_STRE2|nr:ABC transporter solute-binding protein [Streptomyces pristinaespiralis]EDY65744.1 ABC transporter solute-binding protein [Streptomyces pristinaespiralis ATCC 25486]
MQRRFLGLTAAVAALGMTVSLAGCGSSSGSGDGVTLKLVAADYDVAGGESSKKYWADLTAAFEAENPGIKVDVQIESWNDVDRKVAEMVKAGKAPDIAQIGAYADYAAADKLYSADQMLSIPVQSNFLPPLTDAGEMKRTQYGLPFVASTRLLFYNKELFEDAGISGAPGTWEELAEDAELLKQNTDVDYPFALPLGPEEAQAETMMWLLSGGGGYTDELGRYAIDSQQNIDTFEWLKENLVEEKLTGPVAPGKLNRKDAFAAFTRGDVGMLNGHPSLLQAAEKAGIDVGKVALPGRSGPADTTMGVADWIMGFKQNGHRTEIGKFLDFLFTDENVLEFAGQNDLLPVTVSAQEEMKKDPEHADLKEFLEVLPGSVLPPVGKTSWASASENIKKNIGDAVGPGGSPARTLDRISQDARAAESAE